MGLRLLEAEKFNGTPIKLIDEMNVVKEENLKMKNETKELKSEIEYLKKVKRDQGDALVGASKKNNEAYIVALVDENKKNKSELRALKELFDQAVKDQVSLHD